MEAKLAESSLEHQEEFEKYKEINGPEAILDVIQARHASRCNAGGDSEIEAMKREMQASMMRRESLLDEFCDNITEHGSIKTNGTNTTIKKLDLSSNASTITTTMTTHSKNKKSKEIDPTKKSKLLQALKAIDGSEEHIN